MSRKKKLPLIAIVGRPNVGKSSLFNRILGKKLAIVDDVSGITRDRIFATIDQYEKSFGIIDTGGLSFNDNDDFQTSIAEQVQAALEECEAVIFVVDGLVGLSPRDKDVADIIRRSQKPCYVAVNKLESPKQQLMLGDFSELGFEQIVPISAKQNLGVRALLEEVSKDFPKVKLDDLNEAPRIAVLGRPNAGKSSLINKLVNEERLIVSEISGTTRDAVDIHVRRDGKSYLFIDTAGLRYKSKIKDGIEFYSATRTQKSLDRCDVALVLITAEEGLSTQDLKILKMVEESGKACVLLVNKWDLRQGEHPKEFALDKMERIKPYSYLPMLFISAIEGKNVFKILELVHLVDDEQNIRIATGILNRFLKKIVKKTPPPRKGGKLLKFYYMSQVDRMPPSFLISVNHKNLLDPSYIRYIENSLRAEFGFTGAPLKFKIDDQSEKSQFVKKRKITTRS